MLRTRYFAWDEPRGGRVNEEALLSSFASHLSRGQSVAGALAELLRDGVELEGGGRIGGLADLLEQVRQALRERLARLDIQSALAELWDKVARLVAGEDRAGGCGAQERLGAAQENLSDLISRLRERKFAERSSAELLQELVSELGRIRRLEQLWRQGVGRRNLPGRQTWAEAATLLDEIEQLKLLESELAGGDPSRIDPRLLCRLLGPAAEEGLERIGAAVALLEKAGYVMERGERAVLSPKGVRAVGRLALRDIYRGMVRDRAGGHQVGSPGGGAVAREASRPAVFGERLEIDLTATLRRALCRRPELPLRLEPGDFMTFEADYTTSAATVLLLDMSWSMSWEGRFAAAKKVAMALESLVRSEFPRDFFGVVGFFTRAVELKVADLPEASWNVGDPFTNLQEGLRLAGRVLERQRSRNRQIILITDGQPTAYTSGGRLYCEWPLSFGGIGMRAARAALDEVGRITRAGIRLNTFMLDDSPNLKVFVEQMTRLNRGRALYTRPDQLGRYVLVDYVQRKRRKF